MLENCKLRFRYLVTADEVIETAVEQLNDNKIVAWMHGRMEFGARALGNRSILASPLDPYSTENLNIFIKHREPFRKFAASVPAELRRRVLRGRPECALSRDGRPRPPGASRDVREPRSWRATWSAFTRWRARTIPLYWRLLHAAGQVDRAARALQHVVQPLRRAAGLHAARRGAELLLLGHRRDVRGELLPAEVSSKLFQRFPILPRPSIG